MSHFIDEALNDVVYDILIHHSVSKSDGEDRPKIYNFSSYELPHVTSPWDEDIEIDLDYKTFEYSPTISMEDLSDALHRIVDYNAFIVLGSVKLESNLVIRMACFTQEKVDALCQMKSSL